MGFFSRDWIDRLLGRQSENAEPRPDAPVSPSVDAAALDDGASAARDDTVRDPTPPQPPPGTG